MAIKAGQILHSVNGTVIDRIQTGGVGNVNIPQETIYELGNYNSVAILRDIPDLSFDMESFDVSCEVEALLTAADSTAITAGQQFDFGNAVPIDVISPFKSSGNSFSVVKGVAVPSLTLESCTYRFGVRANATQSFSLKGDAIYYIPGAPKITELTVTAGTNQAYAFGGTSLVLSESGFTKYAYAVCAYNPITKIYTRLFFGDNYTNTATGIVALDDLATAGYTKIRLVWGTATSATYGTGVHQGTTIKPAAVRGKDLDVYVSNGAATPVYSRWRGVQSIECSRKVSLQADEELGNPHYVTQDYDVPDVSGSVVVKPSDAAAMWLQLQQITASTSTQVSGALGSTPLGVEMRVHDPDTGVTLKTIYIPDARFTIPGYQGRVQNKLEVTFPFKSDSGTMYVYNGARP